MTHKAKCRDCSWKVKADGSFYFRLAISAHRQGTSHRIKIKEA